MEKNKTHITKDMTIDQVIKEHPQTKKVFEKFFGAGCFTCPGATIESIDLGAALHGLEVEEVIRELNEAIENS